MKYTIDELRKIVDSVARECGGLISSDDIDKCCEKTPITELGLSICSGDYSDEGMSLRERKKARKSDIKNAELASKILLSKYGIKCSDIKDENECEWTEGFYMNINISDNLDIISL